MPAPLDPALLVERRRFARSEDGALSYNSARACAFICARTGAASEVVECVVRAHTLYLAALGLVPAEEAPEDVNLDAIARNYEDLFPHELRALNASSFELEAEFVSHSTELPYRLVRTLLLAESAYEVLVGVLTPAAYATHEAWVRNEQHPVEVVDKAVREFSFAKLHE